MAPDAIEARLSHIQDSIQKLCELQGATTANVAGLQRQFDQFTKAHDSCRAECAKHRGGIWEKIDAQDDKIGKTREEQAGETGTNRAKWATWTALALLVLSSAAGWITNLGKH